MNVVKIVILILIRTITSLIILVEPFLGILVSNFFDAFDVAVMDILKISNYFQDHTYQLFDKLMDNFLLICCFTSALILPIVPAEYALIFVLLFAVRIIGSVLMLITHKRKILLLTPNFFMYYFAVFAFMYSTRNYTLLESTGFYVVVGILFLINYGQEITLHYIQYNPWITIVNFFRKKN